MRQKSPRPERPLPPGKPNTPTIAGTRIHDAAERFVRGGIEMIPEPENKSSRELERPKVLYAEGKSARRRRAMNRAWECRCMGQQ